MGLLFTLVLRIFFKLLEFIKWIRYNFIFEIVLRKEVLKKKVFSKF